MTPMTPSRLPRSVSIDPGIFDRAVVLAKQRKTTVHRMLELLIEAELAREEGAV